MKSTQAMRDRIRELMTTPQDDYDRAVECVLDDLEGVIKVLEEIVDPLSALRERAETNGDRLNGVAANSICSSAPYLQGIARKALGNIA